MLDVIEKEVRIFVKGHRERLDRGPEEANFMEEGKVVFVNEVGIELLSEDFFHQFFPWTSIDHISWDG